MYTTRYSDVLDRIRSDIEFKLAIISDIAVEDIGIDDQTIQITIDRPFPAEDLNDFADTLCSELSDKDISLQCGDHTQAGDVIELLIEENFDES